MSRVPATLLYLTIYNPSLQPTGPVPEDDEDAEEQAHILFYTSRERAVSRDRMLRQVGLAKALINFSEMFNVEEACNNVHSQSRRMIMIEPEPDFWIHAGIEVAKTPKPPVEQGKKKGKGKEENEKGKYKGRKAEELVYDYHDASVHDLALRTDIFRAYEQFKLTHGSFTAILAALGKEALGLQLERFFTVWAWSWNLEEGHQFGPHLGIPLHPSCRSLTPHLDAFASQLPQGGAPFIFSPSFLIPSATFAHARYPPTLARYLMSRIPPRPTTRILNQVSDTAAAETTVKARQTNGLGPNVPATIGNGSAESQSTFLGMPTMNMNMNVNVNMNMDVRKWGWPGYLTFKRNAGKKLPDAVEPTPDGVREHTGDQEQVRVGEEPAKVDVDKDALEDAMASDTASILAETVESITKPDNAHSAVPENMVTPSPDRLQATETSSRSDSQDISAVHTGTHNATTISSDTVEIQVLEPSTTYPDTPPSSSPSILPPQTPTVFDVPLVVPPPRFSSVYVYLAESDDILVTQRQTVYYIIERQLAVAIVGMGAGGDQIELLSTLAEKALGLLTDVEKAIQVEEEANEITQDSIQSATNILEPKDRHIISIDDSEMTVSSPGFTSNSEHLYNAKQLFEKDPHILEVFSRGQNPQHWHAGRHGLGTDNDGVTVEGEIYVEVSRKERSITDVDNVVALLLQGYCSRHPN